MPKKEPTIKGKPDVPKGKPKQKVEYKKIIRVAEADLDGSKKLEHALISIKGVSWAFAHAIRKALHFDNKLIVDLSDEEINKIREVLANPDKFGIPAWLYNRKNDVKTGKDMHVLSSDLILSHKMDIQRLKAIRCYRGVRHFFNHKVRGQRTRSCGANVRGRTGATVGVVRKKLQPQKSKKK